MPRRISEAIGVPSKKLKSAGAFDAFVDVDSKLYVDPSLLRRAKIAQLQDSHKRFQKYFAKVIRLLGASQADSDPIFREAVRRLIFKEDQRIKLGYSKKRASGSGIGPDLAARLAVTARSIVQAGIKDPVIFELVGLIEDGIGADRISDMTIRIIRHDLLAFSQQVVDSLGGETAPLKYQGIVYNLPKDKETGKAVVLLPQEVLRDLPVAEDWSDVDIVASHNSALRHRVNKIIGRTWKTATQRISKSTLRHQILTNPDLLRDLIEQYRNKPPTPYDFKNDPSGLDAWYDVGCTFAIKHPLDLHELKATVDSRLPEIVRRVCTQFQTLIETNGLDAHLYSGGKLRHERFAQLLFFAVADSYCDANGLDLSREPNAGAGPVDFKLSKGAQSKVNVEVKYSTNRKLVHGYTKQLPQYDLAEGALHSFYLIIRTGSSEAGIKRIKKLERKAREAGKRAPEVFVVDGRPSPSASKL
jgi:hypothetical protein